MSLDEWVGASELAAEIDLDQLAADAKRLVDLVLTDDMAYMDSLPLALQDEIIQPLIFLGEACDLQVDGETLVAVCRLVRRRAGPFIGACPPELGELILRLPN